MAFAIVVLILAFGSVLAMGLPIAVAVGGVGAGDRLATIAGHVLEVPDFSTVLGMMIGLGVGIDYALFIVTRYREALHRGLAPRDALTEAMGSAGRAVIFAGFTVVISMLGLLLIGIGWIGGMGIAISLTVLTTMISSVTLLPALLGWAGERVQITRWRGLIAAGFAAVRAVRPGHRRHGGGPDRSSRHGVDVSGEPRGPRPAATGSAPSGQADPGDVGLPLEPGHSAATRRGRAGGDHGTADTRRPGARHEAGLDRREQLSGREPHPSGLRADGRGFRRRIQRTARRHRRPRRRCLARPPPPIR